MQQPEQLGITIAPDPITTSGTIAYRIDGDATVDIKIFSTLGECIATFVHSHQSMGEHSVTWSPENIPAGTYFCRMTRSGNSSPRVVTRCVRVNR